MSSLLYSVRRLSRRYWAAEPFFSHMLISLRICISCSSVMSSSAWIAFDRNSRYMHSWKAILEFSKSTYLAISKALDNLSAKGMQKLIIDLRNNPGGDVDSALAIADLFISNSDLMYLTYKDTSKNAKFSASNT